jgi:LysR family cyn operon transcriptional activator
LIFSRHANRHALDASNEFIVLKFIQNPYHGAMNLRHLRTFVAIAEAGGVARAASRLNITQPTASRQIHALEAELDVPLFDRISRRLQLTSEGEDLLQRSRRLLSEAEALGERARALKSGQTGVLRLGATPQLIESLLVDFLAQYQGRHPGVEVHPIEDGGVRLLGRLERGDVHLTITTEGDERFRSRLLYPVYLLAVLPKNHRLSRRAALDVAELADEPLLPLSRGFGSREWLYAACQVAHIRPHVFFDSAAPQTLIALAAGGYGIAVIPAGVLIPRGKVRAVPLLLRGTPVGRWQTVAWHPQRFLAPYAEHFVEELVIYTSRTYPNRDLTRRAPSLPRPKEPVS